MGENTKIQWAHHTFNPWRGCTKVAAGCANCYADKQSKRNPKTLGVWGPSGTRVVASESMWREPLKWSKAAVCACDSNGSCDNCLSGPPRVFCASLADVFEDWKGVVRDSQGHPLHDARAWKMPRVWAGMANQFVGKSLIRMDDVRARLFRLIDKTPNLDWLLLTKRPENVGRMWKKYARVETIPDINYTRDKWVQDPVSHRANVWLGTSIACQEDADRNIPELLKCRDLATKLFLSIEPMIGPVDIREWFVSKRGYFAGVDSLECGGKTYAKKPGVDWVIVGGESGPNARPCDISWIRSIVEQCQAAGVPVFVKQLGSRPTEYVVTAVGQDAYGNVHDDGRCEEWKLRDRKGGDPAKWPADIRVREFPGRVDKPHAFAHTSEC